MVIRNYFVGSCTGSQTGLVTAFRTGINHFFSGKGACIYEYQSFGRTLEKVQNRKRLFACPFENQVRSSAAAPAAGRGGAS
jgi:hypothetical protein